MPVFNVKKFQKQSVFVCKKCSFETSYIKASGGCPFCGHNLFKVADRTGTPTTFVLDKKDPYLRQKQKPQNDKNDGTGNKLVTPFDEDGFGGGMGGRFRGAPLAGPGPSGFSQTSDEYKDQLKKDLPHEDTNIDHPPVDDTNPMKGFFSDPEDPLSSTQEMNRNMSEKSAVPMENQLTKARQSKTLKTRLDDSIYGKTITRLKGVQR